MKDFIPKGTGNSRYMKSSLSIGTTWEQALAMLRAGTFPFDLNGVNAAGVAQMGSGLNTATFWPDAVAALYGLGADSLPKDAFEILSKAAINKTVTYPVKLSDIPVGTVFQLKENGVPTDFVKMQENYNGSGKTLVARKTPLSDTVQWATSSSALYSASTLDSFLNNTYAGRLADIASVRSVSIKIYNRSDSSSASITTISRKFFAFSGGEVISDSYGSKMDGYALPPIAVQAIWTQGVWTRTPDTSSSSAVLTGSTVQSPSYASKSSAQKVIPMFCLDPDFKVSEKVFEGLYDLNGNPVGVQLESGSYVGSGTYGEENPNKIVSTFAPDIIIIYSIASEYELYVPFTLSGDNNFAIPMERIDTTYHVRSGFRYGGYAYNSYAKKSEDGKTLYWYNSKSETNQMNEVGKEYFYICLKGV